ncbi:DUF6932 family protein [Tellurirhabdus rosea]|uniref:DUF6932 family protein n=1 Tax=Tellurirhabdus rosea TaxID=2674997 RepID=UPI0022563C13|nr:hypothetical protein [Tellurirhabdus rosea]
MQFDEYGHLLPYEPILADLETFEQEFVAAFPASASRRELFLHYCAYVQELKQWLPGGFTQWIDGSFVTRKLNPKDIDVVTFVPYNQYTQHEPIINELRQQRISRKKQIDGYFVKTFPENHRLHHLYVLDRADWLFQFSGTRDNRNKGFIVIRY